jgi:hypothetical protein
MTFLLCKYYNCLRCFAIMCCTVDLCVRFQVSGALNGLQMLLNYDIIPSSDIKNIMRVLSIQAGMCMCRVLLAFGVCFPVTALSWMCVSPELPMCFCFQVCYAV